MHANRNGSSAHRVLDESRSMIGELAAHI